MIKNFEVPLIFYRIVTLRLVTIQCKEVFLRSRGHEKKNHNYIFSYMQISDHETLQPPALWIYNLTPKPILLGDALSWYILIIGDFGPALCRSVNFDLFLMLFITDNLGGGIHSSYLVAWGISFGLFHFLPPLKHRETLRFHLKLFFTHRQTWLTTLQKALKVQTVGGPSVKSAMIVLRYAATPQLSSNPCRARLKRVKSYVIGEREREREILPNRLLLVSILSDRLSVTWQLQGNYQSSEGGLKLTK